MKKILSVLLTLAMLVSLTALAEDAPIVRVSISDDTGALVLACQPVAVTDADGDGALTICDALMGAHIACHPDGAEAFLAEETEWGKSLYRLWGVENGGSYGYMLNDVSPLSLLDPVKDGDHVKAYAFTDLNAYSDTYAFFNASVAAGAVNGEVALTLLASGYDENWNPVVGPVEGAVLTVNGEKAEAVTDENGQAILTFAEAGAYVVSAVSDSMTLVPPVCIVTIGE